MSKQLRFLTVAVVVAFTAVLVSAPAFAQGEKKEKKAPGVMGKVTAVDQASISVETKAEGVKKFKLTEATVYEKAAAEKGGQATPAKAADVKVGSHVKIVVAGEEAKKVTIAPAHERGQKKEKGEKKEKKQQ